jgi:NDP-sugar pyrophosphorylase family protein
MLRSRPRDRKSETMKAVILAGGEGTRLRPLTLGTPKPIVPVVDRPFLVHQIDLLKSAGIHEIVFSVAYKPERLRETFGTGEAQGVHIEYVSEDPPLGTGGAVRNALPLLDERTVVLNGDILTDVDLRAVIEGHVARKAAGTLVLTPVANPSAYGLVETDASGRILRFIEKPRPDEITTDTINAGVYVLETGTLALMPEKTNVSIERMFFPALIARGDLLAAHVHRSYWVDIGTPEKYRLVHRDILDGRFPVALAGDARSGGTIHPEARVHQEAILEPPFFVGPLCEIAKDAKVGPHATLVGSVHLGPKSAVRDSVLWEGCRVDEGASLSGALLAKGCRIGRSASVGPGSILGEGTLIPDFSRAGDAP